MSAGFWLLPTMQRPRNVKRLIDSYNAVGENADVVVCLWENDPYFAEYEALEWPGHWELCMWDAPFYATEAMEKMREFFPEADFYGFLGDDVVFKTPFSKRLSEAAMRPAVAWPDDGYWGERLCTHFVAPGEFVRRVGYWALPGLRHNYIDNVWWNLGKNMQVESLAYCGEVLFEHRHPIASRGVDDRMYARGRHYVQADKQVYEDWCNRGGLERDLGKLGVEVIANGMVRASSSVH